MATFLGRPWQLGTWLACALTVRVLVVALVHTLEGGGSHSAPTYTDIDYHVLSDAGALLLTGRSPYDRATFRYPPLLAWVGALNTLAHPCAGKLLFCAADLLAGLAMHAVLLQSGVAPAQACPAVGWGWLLNPLTVNISTRGSSDSLPCCLVLGAILGATSGLKRLTEPGTEPPLVGREASLAVAKGLLRGRSELLFGSVAHGLAMHAKIYPVIYLPAFTTFLLGAPSAASKAASKATSKANTRGAETWRVGEACLWLGLSLGTWTACTGLSYAAFGHPFLRASLWHHLKRADHRHNYSPWWYPLYLTYEATYDNGAAAADMARLGWYRHLGLGAMVPQLAFVLAAPWLLFRRPADDSPNNPPPGATPDATRKVALEKQQRAQARLPLVLFVTAAAFVHTNKVITAQYFVWYLSLAPLIWPRLHWGRRSGVALAAARRSLALWVLAMAHWLAWAYLLEFRGLAVWTPLWLASLAFQFASVNLVAQVAGAYQDDLLLAATKETYGRAKGDPAAAAGRTGSVGRRKASTAASATTADTKNRKRDKRKVEQKLGLSERLLHDVEGNSKEEAAASGVEFRDLSGLVFARGYERVLYGDHGPYLEFAPRHVLVDAVGFHSVGDYYDLFKTKSGAGAKLYWQKKTVADRPNPPQGKGSARHHREGEGYADYRVGFWYVSPRLVEVGGRTWTRGARPRVTSGSKGQPVNETQAAAGGRLGSAGPSSGPDPRSGNGGALVVTVHLSCRTGWQMDALAEVAQRDRDRREQAQAGLGNCQGGNVDAKERLSSSPVQEVQEVLTVRKLSAPRSGLVVVVAELTASLNSPEAGPPQYEAAAASASGAPPGRAVTASCGPHTSPGAAPSTAGGAEPPLRAPSLGPGLEALASLLRGLELSERAFACVAHAPNVRTLADAKREVHRQAFEKGCGRGNSQVALAVALRRALTPPQIDPAAAPQGAAEAAPAAAPKGDAPLGNTGHDGPGQKALSFRVFGRRAGTGHHFGSDDLKRACAEALLEGQKASLNESANESPNEPGALGHPVVDAPVLRRVAPKSGPSKSAESPDLHFVARAHGTCFSLDLHLNERPFSGQ